MLSVGWYFYGGVNEEGRKTEKKVGMDCCTGSWIIIKQLVIASACGAIDYESDIFQLKDSIDKGRLISKIIIFLFQKWKL